MGEIADEYDEPERLIQRLDKTTYRVAGKLPIEELNTAVGLSIANQGYATVAGWVLDLFGRVPAQVERTALPERHGHRREDRAHADRGGAHRAPQARRRGGGGMTLVWLALVCLLVTVFFSAAEMSFIAANRLRLRHLAEEGTPSRPSLPRRLQAARRGALRPP